MTLEEMRLQLVREALARGLFVEDAIAMAEQAMHFVIEGTAPPAKE